MIFSVGLYGEIHKNDARRWMNSLRRYAQGQPAPFYALIDLSRVSFIGTTARVEFAEASQLPQVKELLFVANEPHMQQAVHMIAVLGKPHAIHIFSSVDDARQYVEQAHSCSNAS